MALGALLISPQNSVLHIDNQARELTRLPQPHRLKLWLSSSCDKTVSSINQKGRHHTLCSRFSTVNTNQTVPWVEAITGLNAAVQNKAHSEHRKQHDLGRKMFAEH